MTSEEISGYVLLAAYGLMLLGVVKVLGIRRVVFAIGLLMFLAVVVALKSLGAITSGRRY